MLNININTLLKKINNMFLDFISRSISKIKKLFSDESLIFYIGGNDNLPSPLSDQEEKDLILLLEQNNQAAKSKLIEHNLRLVVYIARKFENTNINLEDLISIGTIGLLKSINTFRIDKNIKLATYASRCIENEILMYLRRNTKTKNEVSIDEPLNTDCEGNELLLSDVLGTDNDAIFSQIEDEIDKKLLIYAINKLNKREKQIVILRYGLNSANGEEKTQKEVADMLGISQSYISRLEKRIITRLKKEIDKKMA